ncbi:MAG: transcriptional repressor [Desulfomonilaceae bacterium]|jgi:Fur family peroxide stress response transcriptional regulator
MPSQATRDDKVVDFKKVCRNLGIKVTPQRLEIFLELIDAGDHPSAEELFQRVRLRLPTISLDTVYRTLTFFELHGLISKVYFCGDRTRFDPNTKIHHHLVCVKCKRLTDFYWPEIDSLTLPVSTKDWGLIDTRQVQIHGVCARCMSELQQEKKM